MRKHVLAVLAMLVCIGIFPVTLLAQDEEITLTTYYPAPYGEYDSLSIGSTFVAPAEDGRLIVNDRVGIGTDNPQAVLDVMSTTSGFLPPRMTTAQGDVIPNPPVGSVIYNTTRNRLEYFNGTNWLPVGHGAINLDIGKYRGNGSDNHIIETELTAPLKFVLVIKGEGSDKQNVIRTSVMQSANSSSDNTQSSRPVIGDWLTQGILRFEYINGKGCFILGTHNFVNAVYDYYHIAIS
jgi:hypothetical protein